jgi:zinc finger BED domain-containing protein 1 (E3 SUMO-protein ligase ZBED1)
MATARLSGTNYPSRSMVIPLLYEIDTALQELSSSPYCGEYVQVLQENFQQRFGDYRTDEHNAIACFVDPRYKAILFEEAFIKRLVSERMNAYAKGGAAQTAVSSNTVMTPASSLAGGLRAFQALAEKARQSSALACNISPCEAELRAYMTEDIVEQSADPLAWWKTNQFRFPLLASVARVFLGIPATEVESERVFSRGGNLLGIRRCSLKPSMVEMCLVAQANFDV